MSRPLTSSAQPRLAPAVRAKDEDKPSALSRAPAIGNGTKTGVSIWTQGFPATTKNTTRSKDSSGFLGLTDSIDTRSSARPFGQALDLGAWKNPSLHWNSNGLSSVASTPEESSERRPSGSSLLGNATQTRPVGSNIPNAPHELIPFGTVLPGIGATMNGLGHFTRPSVESTQTADSASLWTDSAALSPNDDQRSYASDHYYKSGSSSQHPSLPPSRHGTDSTFASPVNISFTHNAAHHVPSLSSTSIARPTVDRQHSSQMEVLAHQMNRIAPWSIKNTESELPPLQTQQLSSQANGHYTPQLDNAHCDGMQPQQNPSENVRVASCGHYSPNRNQSFGNHLAQGPVGRKNSFPLTAGNEFHYSNYMSYPPTPSMYENPYSSQMNSNIFSNTHSTILNRKLRGLQQEQAYSSPVQNHGAFQRSSPAVFHPNYQFNEYTPPYNVANGLPINTFNHTIAMPPLLNPSIYTPMLEAPRGPRENDGKTIQSQTLADFKGGSKNRQWQLKDIQGHAVEFCGDQIASRFIQTKLETANSDEKQQLFVEILPDILPLMTDVFGNYVIQKFFDHGDQAQKGQIASQMKGNLRKLSMQMYGCRVVQKAIERILTSQQAELIRELEPWVIEIVKNMNGNHVMQVAIERIPAEHTQFIIDAFEGRVHELATHTYGCRVIQRVLEYCTIENKQKIFHELHICGSSIMTDSYGNYVSQSMMKFGSPDDKQRVLDLVKLNLIVNAKHKFASNVVETCFEYGSHQQKHDLLHLILDSNVNGESGLLQLMKDSFGNYVIQTMLEFLDGDDFHVLTSRLIPELHKAKRMAQGKQVAAVEKKMQESSGCSSLNSPQHSTFRNVDIEATATVGASPSRSRPPPSSSMNGGQTNISAARESRVGMPMQQAPHIMNKRPGHGPSRNYDL